MDKITDEKIKKYFDVTSRAIGKVKLTDNVNVDFVKIGKEFLETAENYFKDAQYYYKKGDTVTAFAALNYAHGWLDAGARLGVFDVDDNELFSV